MSPDRASCSTRCGIGVCGGGSRSTLRRRTDRAWARSAGRPSSAGSRLATPLPQLALGRAPASRRRGRPSRGRRRRRRARAGCASAGSRRRPGRRSAGVRPSSRSRQRGQPGRHLVDRRRGDDQDAEDGEQHQQRHHDVRPSAAGRAAGWTRRSRWRRRRTGAREASPSSGCGLPLAMWTMPREPKPSASQPITCRPAGPLCSGSRMLRHPMSTSITGTSQPTLPTEPDTTVRPTSMTPPGSCHQTAAAATTASPIRKSPTPSRRCSGSRSRAAPPILRAPAPTPWAVAIQVARDAAAERAEAARDRTAGRCGRHAVLDGGSVRWTSWLPSSTRSGCSACGYSVIGSSSLLVSSRRTGTRTCSCSATPAGKTYGSPWWKARPQSHQSHGPHGCVSPLSRPREAV